MDSKVVDALPLIVLLAPDEDFAVVRRRGEDGAVLWVRLLSVRNAEVAVVRKD